MSGRVLVTGSAGHLGEALVRVLSEHERDEVGLDLLPSPFTTVVGSITDRDAVRRALDGVGTVLHAATLHKPQMGSHGRAAFVDTNIIGTLTLLEEAIRAQVSSFVFTSTTSAFGRAMRSERDEPAVWVTEDTVPVARNIYGVTKTTAEDLCQLVHQDHGLPVVTLRTARFFPEADDQDEIRISYSDANVKANEYLYRRVDLQDVVDAHLLAADRSQHISFGRYIISATTPFARADVGDLGQDAPAAVRRLLPDYAAEYGRRGWAMFSRIDRVYDNTRARTQLGWTPRYDYRRVLDSLQADEDPRSPLAQAVGAKGYHPTGTAPYTAALTGDDSPTCGQVPCRGAAEVSYRTGRSRRPNRREVRHRRPRKETMAGCPVRT